MGHLFIPMAMEVHNASRHDMDCFIRECTCFLHDRQSKDHLSLSYCIQFFKQHVNITLQCALASAIERKIALTGDACSKPPTTIRSHDLHVGDVRGAVGEIASYHKRDYLSPSFWALRDVHLLAFLWPPPFGLPWDGSGHRSFVDKTVSLQAK